MRLATFADKAFIQSIINDPLLTTWTAFDGATGCDAAYFLTIPSFAVVGEEGVFLAQNIGRGRYVVHTNLLPECRGAAALRAARDALRIAFLQTDCTELVSMVPANLPQALWFATAMGMKKAFTRKAMWPAAGMFFDMTFVEMSIDDWIRTGACAEKGKWFHDRLDRRTHGEDPIHDAYVGAAVEMVLAGRVHKGVLAYNRWAAFALYEQIKVLSNTPLRIDIRDCVLRVEEGDFTVEAEASV